MLKKDLEVLVKKQIKELKAFKATIDLRTTEGKETLRTHTLIVNKLKDNLAAANKVAQLRAETVTRRENVITSERGKNASLSIYNENLYKAVSALRRKSPYTFTYGLITGLCCGAIAVYLLLG